MKKSNIVIVLTFFFSVGVSLSSCCDTLVLKSGITMKGKIIEKTDKYIKIDYFGVPMTYYHDEIRTISQDGKAVSSGEGTLKSEKPGQIIELCREVFKASFPPPNNQNFCIALQAKCEEMGYPDAKLTDELKKAYANPQYKSEDEEFMNIMELCLEDIKRDINKFLETEYEHRLDNENQRQDDYSDKNFVCKDIEDVTYSAELRSAQHFTIGWGKLPFSSGYGQYTGNAWQDWQMTNNSLQPVVIVPPDNYKVETTWLGGVLTIVYDGGDTIEVYIPDFTDVKGDGFIDKNGKRFKAFYVAIDGSVYYDRELTEH